jgi:predicted metal-dependent HD superfamily phosphohydrolase
MLDYQRFLLLCRRLGAANEPHDLFEALVAAYVEPHRAYHNDDHIADCLAQFDAVRESVAHPDEVEMALWFHDAVYDPRAADNEGKSAAWAVQALSDRKVDSEALTHIGDLILATKHQAVPNDGDAQIVVDVDLSILGRPWKRFKQYDNAIRKEYGWVPETDYRLGRARILSGFLSRDTLFQTAYFRSRYEATARENLARAIARLRERGS